MFLRFGALVLGLLLATSCDAQMLLEKYQPGVHYFAIDPPQPMSPAGDKVEVIEVFSYACPHCATFEPVVSAWRKRMPATAKFDYLPAAWNPQWETFARVYYAAEALGIADKTHDAFFKALHLERRQFASLEDIAQWHAGYGVTAEAFLAATKSFAVETKVGRSRQMVPRWQVDGTPSVVVAGKYRVTGESAGSYDKVFEVVDFLVAKEGG